MLSVEKQMAMKEVLSDVCKYEPIFAAGMKMVWGQVAEGWVIATDEMWKHPIAISVLICLFLGLKKIILKEYKLL